MTDHKITDDEVIKALECCSQSGDFTKSQTEICSPCPYANLGDCTRSLKSDALALINRQKVEIESLKKIGDYKTSEVLRHDAAIRELHKQLETAKSETIKEFAENVNAIFECVLYFDDDVKECILNEIDELVKEMTEADNG